MQVSVHFLPVLYILYSPQGEGYPPPPLPFRGPGSIVRRTILAKNDPFLVKNRSPRGGRTPRGGGGGTPPTPPTPTPPPPGGVGWVFTPSPGEATAHFALRAKKGQWPKFSVGQIRSLTVAQWFPFGGPGHPSAGGVPPCGRHFPFEIHY